MARGAFSQALVPPVVKSGGRGRSRRASAVLQFLEDGEGRIRVHRLFLARGRGSVFARFLIALGLAAMFAARLAAFAAARSAVAAARPGVTSLLTPLLRRALGSVLSSVLGPIMTPPAAAALAAPAAVALAPLLAARAAS
ncbi:MAG: hypothetical protein AAFW46_18790 [Pseudomonadota bacterium]